MTRAPRPIRIEGDVAYVLLTKGYEAVIDAADVPLVEGVCWTAAAFAHTVYAYRRTKATGPVRMHRLILCAPKGFEVDHKDGNGLNNRRSNLRLATTAQNQWNTGITSRNTTGAKGIRWRANRWEVQMTQNGAFIYLGRFVDLDAAKAAYAAACAELRGEFGRAA